MNQNLLVSLTLVFGVCVLATIGGCTVTDRHPASWGSRSIAPWQIDPAFPPGVVEVAFESFGERLNGLIYLANGPGPHPTVVLLHGFPGNEKNLDVAQALRRDGFNVLFFHYRGAWGSGGRYSFSNIIEDVGAATAMLRANASDYRVDADRLIILGHSMGGFAALQAAARDSDVSCVGGIAASDLAVRARAFVADPQTAKGFAQYSDSLSMLKGFSGASALQEISNNRRRFDLTKLAPRLAGKSVLLIAAENDTVVVPELVHEPMVQAYTAQGGIQLTAMVLPGDHSFSWTRGELTHAVLDWADGCR